MRTFFFLFPLVVLAQDKNLDVLEQNAEVKLGSKLVYTIYDQMLQRGLENGAGHTMAAGRLAVCRIDEDSSARVKDFIEIFNVFADSKHATIRRGRMRRESPMTYAAATLTCKKGSRTAGELVTSFDKVYDALLADGVRDWHSNVVVAAELVAEETAATKSAPEVVAPSNPVKSPAKSPEVVVPEKKSETPQPALSPPQPQRVPPALEAPKR